MVEGARLESVYTGNRIVGSNPTPSARKPEFAICENLICENRYLVLDSSQSFVIIRDIIVD